MENNFEQSFLSMLKSLMPNFSARWNTSENNFLFSFESIVHKNLLGESGKRCNLPQCGPRKSAESFDLFSVFLDWK